VVVSRITIQGVGAVSPAGWSVADLLQALSLGTALPVAALERPARDFTLPVRRVPSPASPQAWLRQPRLRRVSPISRFATAAALEALGADAALVGAGALRLGIVYCVMAGCVNYSSRFYQEVLNDPATASPLVFPETVFNAPASHLAALLGTTAVNYTQVGDDTAFVQGLATAAGWLLEDRVDGCLAIGAEECDWLTSDAMRLFAPETVLAEGAGAIYLKRSERGVALEAITDPQIYLGRDPRSAAIRAVRRELETLGALTHLFDSAAGHADPWEDWPGGRTSLRQFTGDAFCAASAWQVVAAAEALRRPSAARVSVMVAGCNHAAIGLSLIRV
jgi:hypothetical protein